MGRYPGPLVLRGRVAAVRTGDAASPFVDRTRRAPYSAAPMSPPPRVTTRDKRRFARLLLAWYDAHGRDLPWRRTRDPYKVLVSEIMLQQTPVQRVLPKYAEWLERFPTTHVLARARTDAVARTWRPLGYNDRATRLHAIAKTVVRENAGAIPATLDGLLALDGIGEYTARAVMQFAYEKPVPVLDTNVARVLARVFGVRGYDGGPPKGALARPLWALADRVRPGRRAYDYAQALMDLGATVCLKRHARCDGCPLRCMCAAFGRTAPETRRARAALDRGWLDVTAAVIVHRARVLVTQRHDHVHLGGMWEFPGGKREPGEQLAACMRREVREELGLRLTSLKKWVVVEHAYPERCVRLHFYLCEVSDAEARRAHPHDSADMRWVDARALALLEFPAADVPVLRRLTRRLTAMESRRGKRAP